MSRIESQSAAQARSKTLYFLTWRWHFYAGLFVIPFMLMLSVTGLVMLLDDELESALYPESLVVQSGGISTMVSIGEQLKSVETQYPDATVTQFIAAKSEALPNRFSVNLLDGRSVFATVDPYTGEVVGEIPRSESWYQLANDIHGTLLVGDWGDYLIEVATSLSVLLLVSGIYLWLPRDNASKAGFLKIRTSCGPRILMRDLHANLGGTLSLVLLLFLLSGLAWAGFWGGKMVQAWSSFPAQMWDDVPLSDKTHASLNHGSEEELPWNLEQTPLPESHDHSAMNDDHRHHVVAGESISLEQVIQTAKQLGFTYYRVNFPRSETGVYTITANTWEEILLTREKTEMHRDDHLVAGIDVPEGRLDVHLLDLRRIAPLRKDRGRAEQRYADERNGGGRDHLPNHGLSSGSAGIAGSACRTPAQL